MEDIVDMIKRELLLRKDYLLSSPVETIYFGGGTPSLLQPKMIESILELIQNEYSCEWKELTLEANPDDLNPSSLASWKSLGIDRLSLGIQSFNSDVLKFYNRAHTSEESIQAIDKARKMGFEKFSLDLIYGFPYKDHSIWEQDLSRAIQIDPGHISSYALTIEPKTALGNWEKKGKFSPADEDFIADQFEMLQSRMEDANYIQYEISNFAKEDQYAIHNSNYWKSTPYLGVGPSAHSFDGKSRGANPRSNTSYIKSLKENEIPTVHERLSREDNLNEYILTGLRTIWGIDLDRIKNQYQFDLRNQKSSVLNQMNQEGWLIWKDNHLSLSKSGKLLADSIAEALFI